MQELLVDCRRTMALYTHAQELILEAFQGCCIFTSTWNSADGLGTMKELLRIIQGCGDTRDNIVWKQERKIKDEVVDSKDGETESEYIDEMHSFNSQQISERLGIRKAVLSRSFPFRSTGPASHYFRKNRVSCAPELKTNTFRPVLFLALDACSDSTSFDLL